MTDMIRLIAFFPLEGAAFYEEDGKSFHTTVPYTPSVTEEVEEAEEFAQTTAGYLDGQGRTFPDFAALKAFLKDFQIQEIRSNPKLVKNRELLEQIDQKSKASKNKGRTRTYNVRISYKNANDLDESKLKTFLKNFQIQEIRTYPTLKRDRELLGQIAITVSCTFPNGLHRFKLAISKFLEVKTEGIVELHPAIHLD
jgi:hypothetical protein